jgi:hypothetical protein
VSVQKKVGMVGSCMGCRRGRLRKTPPDGRGRDDSKVSLSVRSNVSIESRAQQPPRMTGGVVDLRTVVAFSRVH